MPNVSQAAIAVTASAAFTDLVASNAALGSVDVSLQFIGKSKDARLAYVLGGSAPSESATWREIAHGDELIVNAAAIWVRSREGGTVCPVTI